MIKSTESSSLSDKKLIDAVGPGVTSGNNLSRPRITFWGYESNQAAHFSNSVVCFLIDTALLLGASMHAHTNWWSGSGGDGTADLLAKHSAE